MSAITPINYQQVRARRVFKGELKEALGEPSYPESTPLAHPGGGPICWIAGSLYFGSIVMNECTFWHVETVMKKVGVVLGNSKQPLRRGKKKSAV